jgi:Kef-type K+ transport system membrane component KefB
LAFLAGAEVDPGEFRATWRANIAIGVLSFASPFFGAMLACRFLFDWTWQQAQIGGIALSTTSLAVVYAVLVESGLNATRIGKLIMSATFVTDLGTVAALSLLFITPSWWLMPFAAASVALIIGMPKLDSWFFVRYGNRVIEPEFKGALAALLVLMWLAAARWGTRSTPPHVRVPGRPAIQDGQMPGRDIALDPSVDQAPVPAHAARTSGGREPRPARKSD